MTDQSILMLNVRPYECEVCPLKGAAVCEQEKGGCPLRYVSIIEHKTRPLSGERFTKIYLEG